MIKVKITFYNTEDMASKEPFVEVTDLKEGKTLVMALTKLGFRIGEIKAFRES